MDKQKSKRYRRGRRRRMDKFDLSEVSFVDRPAQTPALADIQKSEDAFEHEGWKIEKQRGPREGEDFDAFFRRLVIDEPQLPEAVAQIMFDDATMRVSGEDLEKQFPRPRRNETRSQFVSRMVGDPEKRREFPDRDQLIAVANSVFEREMEKQAGPREGESFAQFLRRMRRDDPEMSESRARRMFNKADEERGIVKRFGILSEVDGHTHVIDIVGPEGIRSRGLTTLDDGHVHEWVRRDDGSVIILMAEGHTHEVVESVVISETPDERGMEKEYGLLDGKPLAKVLEEGVFADLLKAIEKLNSDSPVEKETTMTDLEKAQEQIKALEAEKATLAKVAALSAAQKAHYDSLDEKLDDDARKAFLDMSDAQRDEIVSKAAAKAADADPVVYTADDGTEYRKSDDERLVKMAKDRDTDRKETIRIRKAAEDADLTKRAEGDLANFPGDVDVRKAILKAVDGIADEGIRAKAQDALKAQNARLGKGFETVGTAAVPSLEKSDDQVSAENELDELAKKMAKDEGINFYDAYEKVSEANPELLAKAVG